MPTYSLQRDNEEVAIITCRSLEKDVRLDAHRSIVDLRGFIIGIVVDSSTFDGLRFVEVEDPPEPHREVVLTGASHTIEVA